VLVPERRTGPREPVVTTAVTRSGGGDGGSVTKTKAPA
jgi:hypothetical protein